MARSPASSVLIRTLIVALAMSSLTEGSPAASRPPDRMPDPVVWDSPSADARGSMPLGNGDIGLNAWVDAGGDLLFYIGKTDAWEDNSRLAKVGLVRLRLSPPLPTNSSSFRQELHPARGEMIVRTSDPTNGTRAVRLWVDANHPVIHLEVESDTASTATASFELWRTEPTVLPSIEVGDVLLDRLVDGAQREPTVVEPDTVLHNLESGIGWYHRNGKSVGPEMTMRIQDLLEAPWRDPIIHRVFGAWIIGDGVERSDDYHLVSPDQTHHRFRIHVLTRQPATAEEWFEAILLSESNIQAIGHDPARAAHLAWWRDFWSRSHIRITPRGSSPPASVQAVNRGYALQRYIIACGGRGDYPIKFNGSIFTVPWPDTPGGPDYRRWGTGYWWQNTRLSYTALCTSGDLDLLPSLYKMYAGEVLDVSIHRTHRYFGIENAAYFPECIYPWGAVFSEVYGWDPPAAERTDKLQKNRYHKWEWVSGLEFVFMLQDYYAHTDDKAFLKETILPTALPVLRFFDLFYQTGPDGKLVMHPAQALETWWDATNPMSEVAGLHAVIGRLLDLPGPDLPAEDRHYLEGLRERIPTLPTREVDGVRMLAPAARFEEKRNIENPELYAVFPFRMVSFEKPNATLGIEALHHRLDRGAFGWRQEDIFMAYLGLADEARDYVVERASVHDPDSRFPAFWGPNYDWTPDQDHGGVLVTALQAMLLQSEGDRIFLLPAWPADWDVDFKLHAPHRTTIEGTVEAGVLTVLRVNPEARRRDIVVPDRFRPAEG
ncbi:MAG: DUF5703 domain-containing protein [Opitutaceae bacterium]